MNVYISKSNNCKLDHLLYLRDKIKSNFPDVRILEHHGGVYDPNLPEIADVIFVITHDQPLMLDEQECNMSYFVGKGVSTEIKNKLDKTYFLNLDRVQDNRNLPIFIAPDYMEYVEENKSDWKEHYSEVYFETLDFKEVNESYDLREIINSHSKPKKKNPKKEKEDGWEFTCVEIDLSDDDFDALNIE